MRKAALHTILLVAFVDLMAFGLIIPFQAIYAERMGAGGTVFGILIGTYAAMQFIFTPILGRWSDRVGRRRVLLVSLAGSVISHALLGVADVSHSLALLFVARICDGITGANIATAQAYIADVTDAANRAKGMGLFGAAFGLGFVTGPAIGALLAVIGKNISGDALGTAYPAFGAAVISLVAVLLVWFYLPESLPPDQRGQKRTTFFDFEQLADAWRAPRLRELLIIAFFATFAIVFWEVTFVYLCRDHLDLNESWIGLLFAFAGLLMIIVHGYLVGKLARRFGEPRMIAAGPLFAAFGLLLVAGVSQANRISLAWALLLCGTVPIAFGAGITSPSISSLLSKHATTGKQGMTLGVGQGIASLARALAPPVGGFLYDRGHHLPYLAAAGIFLLVGAFARAVCRVQMGILVKPRSTQPASDDPIRNQEAGE